MAGKPQDEKAEEAHALFHQLAERLGKMTRDGLPIEAQDPTVHWAACIERYKTLFRKAEQTQQEVERLQARLTRRDWALFSAMAAILMSLLAGGWAAMRAMQEWVRELVEIYQKTGF